MTEDLQPLHRLDLLADTPLAPLPPVELVRRRAQQRRDRGRALLAASAVAVVALAATTAAVGASGPGGREVLQPAAPPSPSPVRPSPTDVPSLTPSPSPSPSPSLALAPVPPPPVKTSPAAVPPPTSVPSPRTSAAPPARPSPAATPSPPTRPEFPTALDRDPGGLVWGVYLALAAQSAYDDPGLAEAERQAEAVGYRPVLGDLGCDDGAAEGLGLDPGTGYVAVAIYFSTQRDAQQFVQAFEPEVVGIAEVDTGCNDA